MSKVRLEAFMWGAGTALGELPPYFMARTARLSEKINEDKESEEEESKWFTKAKIYIKALVEKVGFFGILACASKKFEDILLLMVHQQKDLKNLSKLVYSIVTFIWLQAYNLFRVTNLKVKMRNF
ncbi:hypothetical protein RND71_043841 [Anisodus tanguticus]|uniref:Vacuole membrane protein 1 n=1 Tax=Anisodus tanguticus TaxID=243964 RepID=A0AAE1URC6_9SOLA|nr:hypothetical protein RND71_043841 [Anisodus tanguticus]